MTYKAKKLINDPDDVVTEFIQGLVATYPELHYLNGFPQVKIVLRADAAGGKYDKVAVISAVTYLEGLLWALIGGGGGREPAHAGYVGEGMLTAAICGEVFASPQVDAILAGIRAVTGRMGCLLIVMNYKSDRLNFGLAAEQAKSEGYHVETVIVGDDCALPPPRGIAGRRGLAGTLLVHKVAGAAAAAGLSLAEVAAEAEHASQFVGTMGVALSLCTLPGQVTSDRLGHGEMELGVGIHGERGTVVGLEPVHSVVAHVLKGILSQETKYVPISGGDRVVLMVNGLGGTPLMELMIAASSAVPQLMSKHGLDVDRVYTGSFMPSLDMAGFSISIMKADEAILQRLDAPTKAPSWPVGVDGDRPAIKKPVPMPLASSMKTDELLSFGHICCPIAWMMNKALLCLGSLWVSTDTSNAGSRSIGRPLQLTEQGHTLEAAIEAAANAVIVLASNLNEWDSKVGDSDYGSKMHLCATTILEDMKSYPLNDAAETINEIGSSIRRVMGGTSGILYAILLTAAYARLKANSASVVSPKQWAEALEASIAAVSKYGGAAAGDRTMLDALIPASAVLLERLNAGEEDTAFVRSSEAALAGAESTKNMKAQTGDLENVSDEILASVPDPGAMAAASWYRAAALAVQERHEAS